MSAPTDLDIKKALDNWETLNAWLRNATMKEAEALLKREKNGKRRIQYLLRIHARFNKMRANRERAELLGGSKS